MRSRAIVGLAAALLATAGGTPALADADYTVAQCDERNRGHADSGFIRSNGGDYGFRKHCDRSGAERALGIRSLSGAPSGHRGAIIWRAPQGTSVVGARIAADLRRDGGHRARLAFTDAAGRERARIAAGADRPGGFEVHERRLGAGAAAVQAELVCAGAERCPRSEQARTRVRDLRLTLRDAVDPEVVASGDLLAAGWVRGTRSLRAALTDVGSGVRRFELLAGGRPAAPTQTFGCAAIAGTALAATLRPCASSRTVAAAIDTAAAPFSDGESSLALCARDFGRDANRACEQHRLRIDNTAPAGAFRRSARRDPELIEATVSDAHSGVDAATIAYRPVAGGGWRERSAALGEGRARIRVDSAPLPAGRYRFRLRVRDRAGNTAETTRTEDGSPLILSFPLRGRSRLSARVRPRGRRHPYGARPIARGRLRGPGGPARGERVRVIERFASGSRRERRVRTTRTDRHGRYRARLAAGPSRTVRIRFAGSRRLLPSSAPPRTVTITGAARLGISRARVPAGGRVRFRGRVGRRGAEIPARGKLVELQVRESGSRRFRTVRQALHTDRRGRVRIGYSFDRFYRRPARFQFRLRVTPEAGWPYRAPAHSPPRPLTVMPR